MDIEKIRGKRHPLEKLHDADDLCFTRKEIKEYGCGNSMLSRFVEEGKLLRKKIFVDSRYTYIYFFPENEKEVREIING
jgi:hypothetical protein